MKPLRLRLRRLICALVDHDWDIQPTVDVCKRCGKVHIHTERRA